MDLRYRIRYVFKIYCDIVGHDIRYRRSTYNVGKTFDVCMTYDSDIVGHTYDFVTHGIWILATCDIRGLPDITVHDIGVLQISQYPYSDIGATNIGELRYHITPTPISQYQNSGIDSYIGGAVIVEV